MNFAQIRAFYHVVRDGGVGRAATIIGVSQPTVSQHIKELETRYGIGLFEKQGRRLQLTEAGRDLFSVTEKLMRAAAEVNDALERRSTLLGGRLMFLADRTKIAIDLLEIFRCRYPSVEITVRIASLQHIVEKIEEGVADVGVTVDPPAGDNLLVTPLKTERLVAVMSCGHALARMGRVSLSDLIGETLILREPTSRTRALTERLLAMAGVSPQAVLEIGACDAVREAVARGLGVSLVAESDCPPDPRLIHRPLASAGLRVAFEEHLVIRRDRRGVPAVAAFHEVAAGYAAAGAVSAMADTAAIVRGRRPDAPTARQLDVRHPPI